MNENINNKEVQPVQEPRGGQDQENVQGPTFEEILKKCSLKVMDEWVECMQRELEYNDYDFWITEMHVFAWKDSEYIRYDCDVGHVDYFDDFNELKESLLYVDPRAEILFDSSPCGAAGKEVE